MNILTFGAKLDGKQDDRNAFIKAISKMKPGDKLYFPPGKKCYLSQGVNIVGKSKISIVGNGVQFLSNNRTDIFNIERCSDITVENLGYAAAAKAGVARLVRATEADRILIKKCVVVNGALAYFRVTDKGLTCNDVVIDSCKVDGRNHPNADNLVLISGGKNYTIKNSIIGNTPYDCIKVSGYYGMADGVYIINNEIYGAGDDGIDRYNKGTNVQIEGNYIHDCAYSGACLKNEPDTKDIPFKATFINNRVENCKYGVDAYMASDVLIDKCTFKNCEVPFNLSEVCQVVTVSNCHISNCAEAFEYITRIRPYPGYRCVIRMLGNTFENNKPTLCIISQLAGTQMGKMTFNLEGNTFINNSGRVVFSRMDNDEYFISGNIVRDHPDRVYNITSSTLKSKITVQGNQNTNTGTNLLINGLAEVIQSGNSWNKAQ